MKRNEPGRKGCYPSLLKSLNAEQRKAVEFTDGPSLILAGAGSGKTRVLTHKIAYLIDRKKVKPWQILAMTFTNKAAGEMRERVNRLVKKQTEGLWIGTFHSIFARILRSECDKLGFTSNFAIYDQDDQLSLIKIIMNELNISPHQFSPNGIRARINNIKTSLISPQQFEQDTLDVFDEKVALVYEEYQKRLHQNNAMDFDDLLLKPIELFQSYPLVLEYYQDKFHYMLVDEYQDTNRIQYQVIKLLAAKHRNISVVGDDDQSIYHWRGADIKNILDFEKDYPDCRIFRLEQNYRSTRCILAAASSVVKKNLDRMEKELWTRKEWGEKVTLLESENATEEALKIVDKIQDEFHRHKRNFTDFAILYRTNAQSRILEEGLRQNGIAYVIVGGVRFYERKEIKDVLAYLRVLCNPLDTISLKRILNYPLRGIGGSTVAKIEKFCHHNNIPFFQGLGRVHEIDGLSERIRTSVYSFYKLISKYIALKEQISPGELVNALVDELGILRAFKEENTIESLNRAENVRELLLAISNFSKNKDENSLDAFLEEVSLITDIDTWNDRANAVTLMTLHCAKGLEFPVVFIAGLEEGLFPLSHSFNDLDELEEERRLFYVGATRAQEKLYLSWATNRQRFGENYRNVPSRFIREIQPDLIEIDSSPSRLSSRRSSTSPQYKIKNQKNRLHTEKKRSIKHRLKVGCLVRHSTFGRGVVKSIDGKNETTKVTVLFEEVGEKRLVLEYAKLEIL